MGKDQYTKRSHELRIASPSDQRLRFVAGLFWQQQNHDIQQHYKIDGLSPQQSVAGWPDTLWLTKQVRRDHDEAVFGELSYDFTDKLTGTIGGRHFRTENSLEGFFGFGDWGWVSSYGQAICPAGAPTFHGAPCETFDKTTSRDRHARPRQPDLPVRRRAHGLCDLVRRLPSRRHQPSRHPAAVPGRLPDQLRARVARPPGSTIASSSTVRCSTRNGRTSSSPSSAPTA